MATFKAVIKKDNKRVDGTWKVFIRFTHERKIRFIPTSVYVTKKDITSSFKIKNAMIIEHCDNLINEYRKRINRLELELNPLDVDTIVKFICSNDDGSGISFTEFANKWIKCNSEKKEY